MVCDGRVTPRLFLAQSMIECLDHVRSAIFRFKKGGKLRIVLLNQFAGNLPYSLSFANDLVNRHGGKLQSSPDGPDRFPIILPRVPFSPDLYLKPVPVTPELIGHEQILCRPSEKKRWRGKNFRNKVPCSNDLNEYTRKWMAPPKKTIRKGTVHSCAVVTNADGSAVDLNKISSLPAKFRGKHYSKDFTFLTGLSIKRCRG